MSPGRSGRSLPAVIHVMIGDLAARVNDNRPDLK
jgi:hypothetical protein